MPRPLTPLSKKILLFTLIAFILSFLPLLRYYDVRFIPIKDGFKECLKTQGTYGRLVIPDENISVKLNMEEPNKNQIITDKINSALYMEEKDSRIIADHSDQGFRRIRKSKPGKTVLYLRHDEVIEKMVCTKIFKGHNTIYELTDEDYKCIEYDNPNGVITYTCDGSWQNVTIVFWEKVQAEGKAGEDGKFKISEKYYYR